MFIRRTTNSRKTSQAYYTYRLVEGVRAGGVVKQVTLRNLGSHFDVSQDHWPARAGRIDALLHGQDWLQLEALPEGLEAMAQRIAAQIIALRASEQASVPSSEPNTLNDTQRFQEVDINTIEMVRPRCIGIEPRFSIRRTCGAI